MISRKKPEKRSMAENRNTKDLIGIFQGKSGKYNTLILEALSTCSATSWQIAKKMEIALRETQNKEILKEVADCHSRSLYSIIQRKGARLDELSEKGYIAVQEGLYSLTWKGSIALAIARPQSLEEDVKGLINDPLASSRFVEGVPSGVVQLPFGITMNRDKFKADTVKAMNKLRENPQHFNMFVSETKQLLDMGKLNLDVVSASTLLALLMEKPKIRSMLTHLSKAV